MIGDTILNIECIYKSLTWLCRLFGLAPVIIENSGHNEVVKSSRVWRYYTVAFMVVLFATSLALLLLPVIGGFGSIPAAVLKLLFLMKGFETILHQATNLRSSEFIGKTMSSKKSSKIRQIQVLCACQLGVFVSTMIFLLAFYFYIEVLNNLGNTVLAVFNVLTTTLPFMSEIKFAYCLGIIREELVVLNGDINKLDERHEVWLRASSRYSKIYRCSQKLNGIFGLPTLLSMLSFFTQCIVILYFCIDAPANGVATPFFVWLFLFYSFRMFCLLTMCDYTSTEAADGTAVAVSSALARPGLPPAVREELRDLSVQLLHMRLRFTACGFFPLDYTQLHAVIAAITTYLVILLQTQTSTPSMEAEQSLAKQAAAAALHAFANSSMGCCDSCALGVTPR